jgi:RNA polymerase-binding transcription factor
VDARQLQEFRSLLLERRRQIFEKAKEVKKGDDGVSPDDLLDSMDLATSVTTQTLNMQFQDRERSMLLEIDEALRRIENDEFGTCEECDEEIGMGRLRAQPWTRLCVRCKEDEEQNQKTLRIQEIEWGLA